MCVCVTTHTQTHTHTHIYNTTYIYIYFFLIYIYKAQSILKEVSPEYSLEGLMLKLKLQFFGHLMRKTDSLGKTLMLGKIEGGRRRGRQRMRWVDGITDSMDMSLSKLCSHQQCSGVPFFSTPSPAFSVCRFFLVLSLALFKQEIKECLSPKTLMAEGDRSSLNRSQRRWQ